MIVLDTHVLIWADLGIDSLGAKARKTIDEAAAAGGLAVSSISFWEAGMLVSKGRIRLPTGIRQWRLDLLETGLNELALNGATGIAATQLDNMHADPADRMICAAALQQNASLMTADAAILQWNGALARLNARD